MAGYRQTILLGLLTALITGDLVSGQAPKGKPLGVVLALTGGGATRGAGGKPFPVVRDRFSDADSGIFPGDMVTTVADGAALITLPDYGTVIRLGPSSSLSLDALPPAEGLISVAATLVSGEAHVLRRRPDNRWFLIRSGNQLAGGYTLSQGTTLVVRVDAAGASFTAVSGELLTFAGSPPAGPLLDATGQPIDKTGVKVTEGNRLTTQPQAKPSPDPESGPQAAARTGRDLYAFALTKGRHWVEQAERGDFTPIRGTTRTSASFFSADLGTDLAFDQPRSVVTAPAPRVTAPPLRTVLVSPAQALIESGIPTSVVVGQRLRRTRIIGNPGVTGGQIRVNPDVEQLIRLPR